MREYRLEVADVFRTYEKEFFAQWGHVLGPHQRKALEAIRDCRTAALGGHVEYVEQCDTCGHRVISYNSCRDRHCPKCQALARAKWLAERETELLPVPYFHVVFTLPQKIGGLALQNAREIYGILFRAASETLLTIAADPKRLGAAIGFLAVLHTWGQNLHLHPHLHCVVPGGGISPDGVHWIGCKKIVLPTGGRIEQSLQKPIPDLSPESVSGGPAEVPRRDGNVGQSGHVRSPVLTSAAHQMGGVCEAALWRA